jgi:hypothetical protein
VDHAIAVAVDDKGGDVDMPKVAGAVAGGEDAR